MATIYIERSASDDVLARIDECIRTAQLFDINLNGADIRVERDDYTWIDADSGTFETLYSRIVNILSDR